MPQSEFVLPKNQPEQETLTLQPIQSMFEGRIFTINPHSMLIDLKPFIIFVVIKYFPFEYQQIE